MLNEDYSPICLASGDGKHDWIKFTLESVDLAGVDSVGHPVFIEDIGERPQCAFGCDKCEYKWTLDSESPLTA